MSTENLSKEIKFVSNENDSSKLNEAFESNIELAFETNTTGVLMQLEGLKEKNLQTEKDVKIAKDIRTGDLKDGFEMEESKSKNAVGEVNYEILIGEYNNILPIWFLELGYERSKSICLISTSGIDYKGRRGSWQGTGFLISDNILLTNYHVLNSKSVS